MGIFTGLIMEVGRVRGIDRSADGAYFIIECRKVLEGTHIGDSISINGVDLTVVEMSPDHFSADGSLETLKRSTLGQLRAGSRVNLERALAVGERLGGHMVQGHIDGTVEFIRLLAEGNAYRMRFKFDDPIGRYIALKGSVALDGISLTVAAIGGDWFEVAVIPHTWRETTLAQLKIGDRANIEVDVLAKYVERLLRYGVRPGSGKKEAASGLTMEYLMDQGY